MRHFVAYHNTERMGQSLREGDPLRLLTNKPVQRLVSNTVWFVVGSGTDSREYALGSVFVVDDVGETHSEKFKWYAAGSGWIFDTPPVLNQFDWFPDFFRNMAHFSLGVREITDQHVIAPFVELAIQAGYRVR